MKHSLRYEKGRYCVPIPRKDEQTKLPDTKLMALSCLRSTERNLRKKDCVVKDYKATLQAYVEKGYPQKVLSDEQLPNNIWCFPHFSVMRMDKTTRKVQIVFDCAATCKCNGIALSIGSCVVQVHARVRRVLHNLCSRHNRKAGIGLSPKEIKEAEESTAQGIL